MDVGTVVELWRYPVKSMQGEQIATTSVDARGLLGDRRYAVLEVATGHVASAKHPAKWARLFGCHAAYAEARVAGAPLPPVRITLPDGATIRSDDPDVDAVLSRAVGREIRLVRTAPSTPTREANRAPVDADPGDEVIRQEPLALAAPAGTFFDYAPVHLLATSTLARLQALQPGSAWDARRFRPNIVIAPLDGEAAFVENDWLGHALALGDGPRLDLIDPTPRCVVTTLAQHDLPRDPEILRTLARHNNVASLTLRPGAVLPAVLGVYGRVTSDGPLRQGDPARLLPVGA
jgi:uncharacterized protein